MVSQHLFLQKEDDKVMSKLSVVLAVFNEENYLKDCLDSVKEIADEIVIVDGGSSDRTVEIAKLFKAEIIETNNPPIFHINKQKALEKATYEWILQLDADERITFKLANEIKKLTEMDAAGLEDYQNNLPGRKLFKRHQKLIEIRDGRVGDSEGPFNAFFIPRRNFFLGKYLKYGGTYPDPAIRLVKKDMAYFPAKDVHEQMQVKGRVGWLQNYMLHRDSPTFERYLERNNRYINLMVNEMHANKTDKGMVGMVINFLIKPIWWFLLTLIRHKGILDGYQGVIFSLFSALRFPRSYWRYMTS